LTTISKDSLHDLQERIKELECLYRISDLANNPELLTSEFLQQSIDLLPAAMQFPEVACARLLIKNQHYVTKSFHDSNNKLAVEVNAHLGDHGILEVLYPPDPAYTFLTEETKLLEAVAHQLALALDRRHIQEYNDRLQEQLRHADRLATIGQLSAGVAHEINEPLSVILGYSELVLSDHTLPQTASDDINKVVSAALHAREIVRKLMLFSRQVPPNMSLVDVNKVIRDGFYFLERRCTNQGVQIKYELEPKLPHITADPSQLHQVMVNLCVNALQAMPDGGLITISTRSMTGKIEIKVSDTGTGMDEDTLHKIFIPFYTTKDMDQGTGLGLSVVHGIISAHNGAIKVDSTPGKGSVFSMYFSIDPDNLTPKEGKL